MPNLSESVKLVKKYAINTAISDEEILNAFLMPYVIAGKIKNKKHDDFYLNKGRTSEIMLRKADVPSALRKKLSQFDIKEKTIEEMTSFIDEYLDSDKQELLSQDIISAIQADALVSEQVKDGLKDRKEDLPMILTELLLIAITENNRTTKNTVIIWKSGRNSIEITSGDLFHFGFDNRKRRKNIVVIPVNTAFDTHVSRKYEGEQYPLISETTLHGQWLDRMEQSGESIDNIDFRLTNSLRVAGFKPVGHAGYDNGKNICYPIGAVSIIETSNAIYFLVAIAEFDEYNNTRSSADDIKKAVESLINIYDRFGQGCDLYMPLMGTGRSRAGLSNQDAFDLLINSLISNKNKIYGNVHLVITPEDNNDINMEVYK